MLDGENSHDWRVIAGKNLRDLLNRTVLTSTISYFWLIHVQVFWVLEVGSTCDFEETTHLLGNAIEYFCQWFIPT